MSSMRYNAAGIGRLRTLAQVPLLTHADKAGPFMIEMDSVHVKQARRAYTTQGASSGSVWKPLSEGYRQWKRKVRPGRKILVFDGETRERFTMPSHPMHIRRFVAPFTYQFGVASEKAWRAETGTGVGRQALPRRSVLNKTAADIKAFQMAFVAYYIKWVRARLRHA